MKFLDGFCARGHCDCQGACPFASLNIKGCISYDESDTGSGRISGHTLSPFDRQRDDARTLFRIAPVGSEAKVGEEACPFQLHAGALFQVSGSEAQSHILPERELVEQLNHSGQDTKTGRSLEFLLEEAKIDLDHGVQFFGRASFSAKMEEEVFEDNRVGHAGKVASSGGLLNAKKVVKSAVHGPGACSSREKEGPVDVK
jgi:hypothetical protein